MKRYDKYKSSGVEWIGEIPESWNCVRIKRISPVKRGASPRPIDDPKYFDDNGEFAWVRIADVTASERYLENTTQNLSDLGSSLSVKRYPNDFFLSIAGTVGKPIITKIKCCIHDGFVWFPNLKVNPEYLYYIFQTGLPYQGLGKWGTQLNLNTETVGDIFIPIPDDYEIERLVFYLDEKTEQIDKLIAGKRRLIELLKEERTAIINQAVTKGINAHAKLKFSGIDWLGYIPEHWTRSKIGYISKVVRGASPRPAGSPLYFNGNHTAWITVAEVTKDDNKFITGVSEYLTEEGAAQSRFVEIGTLLLSNSGATLGVPKILKIGGCINDGSVAFLNINEKVEINFLYYYFKSLTGTYRKLMQGSGQPNLNTDIVKGTLFCYPEKEEQREIVNYIESKMDEIDLTISKVEKEIELLQEYRTALISEVVTGKIKVV